MFLLCTNGDGKYFKSGLAPLLYPTGCSFYRPFSYQEQWIQTEFSRTLNQGYDENQLIDFYFSQGRNIGFLGFRFTAPGYINKFIPLRRVELISVPVTDDKIHIEFKLGNFISLTPHHTLQVIDLDTTFNRVFPENILLAEVPKGKEGTFLNLPNQKEFPSGLWDSLASDAALPPTAQDNFKETTVIRLVSISGSDEVSELTPQKLNDTSTVYGFELKRDQQYNFKLSYSRIYDPADANRSLVFDFLFTSSPQIYEVTRTRLEVTGNYRMETIGVTPLLGRADPTLIEWVGTKKTDIALLPGADDKVIGIQIPVKNVEPKWTSARMRDLICGSLLLGAALCSFYFGYRYSVTDQPAVVDKEAIAAVLSGFGVFLASWSSILLNDVLRSKY